MRRARPHGGGHRVGHRGGPARRRTRGPTGPPHRSASRAAISALSACARPSLDPPGPHHRFAALSPGRLEPLHEDVDEQVVGVPARRWPASADGRPRRCRRARGTPPRAAAPPHSGDGIPRPRQRGHDVRDLGPVHVDVGLQHRHPGSRAAPRPPPPERSPRPGGSRVPCAHSTRAALTTPYAPRAYPRLTTVRTMSLEPHASRSRRWRSRPRARRSTSGQQRRDALPRHHRASGCRQLAEDDRTGGRQRAGGPVKHRTAGPHRQRAGDRLDRRLLGVVRHQLAHHRAHGASGRAPAAPGRRPPAEPP